MPSPTTAYELIKSAMRVVGITAAGETPTADEANDALSSLNDLLETMSTENLFVWGRVNQTFNTVAAQASYTIGAGGNFNTDRPIRISSAYCTCDGVDFPITIIGQDEYNAFALKTEQQKIIERLLYVNDFPLGVITLWPTPQAIVSLTLSIDRVLTQIAALGTTINYPPGYMMFMKHALGLLLAPEYGIDVSEEVGAAARHARASVKRTNKKKRVATFDAALAPGQPVSWQAGQ